MDNYWLYSDDDCCFRCGSIYIDHLESPRLSVHPYLPVCRLKFYNVGVYIEGALFLPTLIIETSHG